MKSKSGPTKGKVKIRGAKELSEDLSESSIFGNLAKTENPIKRQIRINQFPWTEKQKEFFRVALDPSTNVVFVNGPAGTAKTLLAVYCGLQLLNMKVTEEDYI